MIKTRIAPSPTGDPHVGTAYIALFNYCFARKNGGKFILRIEDTDRTRSAPEYEQAIMDALGWLGIQWDEGPDVGGPCGPYRQSERKDIYEKHAQILLDNGSAYRCFCTAERLDQMRQARMGVSKTTGYDGKCRSLSQDEIDENLKNGIPYVIRLKMPTEGETVMRDRLRGEIRYPNDQLDDQVLLKSDGFPTYHLANVVDDHLMEITHVIRAEEWIPSLPKHLRLYEAFGWQAPEFIHMPLLRNKDKSKISKRKNPTSLEYYRSIGIFPESMLNFLALMGYSLGENRERFNLTELVDGFDIDRVSLGEPVFDLEKLNWLNGLYLRDMDTATLRTRLQEHLFSAERLDPIMPLLRERIRRLDEFVDAATYFFSASIEYDSAMLIGKGLDARQAYDLFSDLSDEMDKLRQWDAASLEHVLRSFCEAKNTKAKVLFMPVRFAMTGRHASPGLFETMQVIGKPICQQRFRDAMGRLKALMVEPEVAE